ncbi:hypothetical protein D3C79_924450 [compost metagenome]
MALFVVGLFGSLCMIKCHGLIRFYKYSAREVATLFAGVDVEDVEVRVRAGEPYFWRCVDGLRLWHLWLTLFLLVSVFGLVMSIKYGFS